VPPRRYVGLSLRCHMYLCIPSLPSHLALQTGIADLLPAIRAATRVHPEDADVVKSTLMLLRMLACGETLKVRSAVWCVHTYLTATLSLRTARGAVAITLGLAAVVAVAVSFATRIFCEMCVRLRTNGRHELPCGCCFGSPTPHPLPRVATLLFQEELIGDAGWAAQVTVPLAGDPKLAVHGVAFLRNLATCVPLKVSTPMMALRCASRHCHHCTCAALHCTCSVGVRWRVCRVEESGGIVEFAGDTGGGGYKLWVVGD
jgi:hypothetical protein